MLGLLATAVAAYYYLCILVVTYMCEPDEAGEDLPPPGAALKLALWAFAAGTPALGSFPNPRRITVAVPERRLRAGGGECARAGSDRT